MRHRKKLTKLGRNIKQRQALFKQQTIALILNGAIKTTEAKAKVMLGLIDKLITKAKKSTLASRRELIAFLNHKPAVHKLIDLIVPAVKTRVSGYTRMVRLGRRVGDKAMIVRLEFVDKIPTPDLSSKESEKETQVKKPKPLKNKILKKRVVKK